MTLSKIEDINPLMRKFADDLKPLPEFYDLAYRRCEKVRRRLEKEVSSDKTISFSISETHYAGSVGKKTDVTKPDFDLVMKINNAVPPFENVLIVFKRILTKYSNSLKIKPLKRGETGHIQQTPYSLQFTFRHGLQVDLLPAVANATEKEVLEKMRRSANGRKLYSSSLVSQQVNFMKCQDAFTHAVARLSKFWYKSMDFGGAYISGGSSIFELLAVAAVMEGKKDDQKESMFDAFLKVVEKVEILEGLCLFFQKAFGSWEIRPQLLKKRFIPYLIEPANPQNNLLHGMEQKIFEGFRKNGKEMKARLGKLKNRETFWRQNGDGKFEIDFNMLFETVPF